MSVCALLGFEQYPLGAYVNSFINPPYPLLGASNNIVNQGLIIGAPSTQTGQDVITDTKLSSTKALQWTQKTAGAPIIGVTFPFHVSGLNRTGTWVMGVRLITGSIVSSAYNASLVTDVNSGGSFVVSPTPNTEYYFELVMNWSTLTLQVYTNGTLTATRTFTTAPTAYVLIGSYGWVDYSPGFGRNIGVCIAANSSISIRDGYFAMNPTGSQDLTPRFGPCFVKAAKVASAVGNNWTVTGSQLNLVDVLNQGAPSTTSNVGAKSSPLGEVLTLNFTPPATDVLHNAPVAVQGNVAALPFNLPTVNLVMGVNDKSPITIATASNTMAYGCLPSTTPPSGFSGWSNDAIAATTVKLNSIAK